jgi:predicted  nucleic acid-binding Zn-ribbon protein
LGEYVGQFIGDYVFQVGVALVVLTGATAAWIISRRRRYVKSVEFKRLIGALRLEFQRSIDEARAATTRKTTAVGDKLFSMIKPIDKSVTDLNVRLARLEERADSVEAFMAGPQKDEENEQITARLRKLEQRLTALSDQVSLIEQTIDGTNLRDQERNNSLEAIRSRLVSTQRQVDDLLPRLERGDKAREDQGGLISLFVKQLKRVNMYSTETAVRVAELENLRSKVSGLEERLSATLDCENHRSAENSTTNAHADVGDAAPRTGDGAGAIEPNNESPEEQPTSTEEAAKEPSLNGAIGANGHANTTGL